MMELKLFIKKIVVFRKITKDFINHNLIFFKREKRSNNKKILLELNNMRDSHIIYSYLSNILSKKYDAEIYGFSPRYFKTFLNFLIFKIKLIFKIDFIYFVYGAHICIYHIEIGAEYPTESNAFQFEYCRIDEYSAGNNGGHPHRKSLCYGEI